MFVANAYRASGGCIISVSEFASCPTVHTSVQFRVLTKRDAVGALHRSVACVQHVDDFCLLAGGYKQKRALNATLDTS